MNFRMNAEDILMYKSIFVLFFGFLVFVMIFLNKLHMFLSILDSYFVLFLFLGVITTIIGIIMLFVWNFKNRKPYEEEETVKNFVNTHFTPYLISGIVFIIIGFSLLFYLKDETGIMRIMSISSSILGIILLLVGLTYYIKEVLFKTIQRTSQH